jgi:hypothetical protein
MISAYDKVQENPASRAALVIGGFAVSFGFRSLFIPSTTTLTMLSRRDFSYEP